MLFRYASLWKGCLTLYTGKTGEIIKIGEWVKKSYCVFSINLILMKKIKLKKKCRALTWTRDDYMIWSHLIYLKFCLFLKMLSFLVCVCFVFSFVCFTKQHFAHMKDFKVYLILMVKIFLCFRFCMTFTEQPNFSEVNPEYTKIVSRN